MADLTWPERYAKIAAARVKIAEARALVAEAAAGCFTADYFGDEAQRLGESLLPILIDQMLATEFIEEHHKVRHPGKKRG